MIKFKNTTRDMVTIMIHVIQKIQVSKLSRASIYANSPKSPTEYLITTRKF